MPPLVCNRVKLKKGTFLKILKFCRLAFEPKLKDDDYVKTSLISNIIGQYGQYGNPSWTSYIAPLLVPIL